MRGMPHSFDYLHAGLLALYITGAVALYSTRRRALLLRMKAANTGPVTQLSMSSMSDDAVQHVCLFLPACTLANVECVAPQLG